MRIIIFTLLALPTIALADDDEFYGWLGNDIDDASPRNGAQVVVGVQPIIPVPRDKGPWGTGYSVITTERDTVDPFGVYMGDDDARKRETVQRVVPNGPLGNPLRGIDW